MTICQANSNFCGCCGCSFKIEWQEAAGSCFAFPYGSGYSLPNFFGTCTTMQILHLNISIYIILTEICPRKGGLGPPETKWPWAVILRKTYNLKLDLKDVVDFFSPIVLAGKLSMLTPKCPVCNADCTSSTRLPVCVPHSTETKSFHPNTFITFVLNKLGEKKVYFLGITWRKISFNPLYGIA